MSALMSTTMLYMETVTQAVDKESMRGQLRLMVGGAPVSESFARQVGADARASHAAMAVDVARGLVAQKAR
ncbi:MAG: hypothetical protein M5U30_03680 [Burkholderiaceae bacterium]|nr:hypothetical protein [Burkholderiaceae bacterium]